MKNPAQEELQHSMNIAASLERGRRLHPLRMALWFEGESWTYAQVDLLASRAAHGLSALGVGAGDRVALLVPNLPVFVFAYLGVLKLGAIAVSINPSLSNDEVRFILEDSGASVLVMDRAPSENEARVFATVSALRHLVDTSEQDPWLPSVPEPVDGAAVAASTPAVIVYTSGTTGFPKGAVLSHGNVRFVMEAKRRSLELTPDDRVILFLPLFHCFGQNAVLNAALHAGASVILQRSFEAEQTVEMVQRHQVTIFCGVPTTYVVLLDQADPRLLASVRLFFSAAAPLPREVERRWHQRFDRPILQGYGLTETSPFATYNHRREYRESSVGTAIDEVAVGVVDITSGKHLPPGSTGEIVIRGPNVMLGYWNRPEETRQVIRDGWFHTGDIGQMDEQGYVFLEDRLKDMIIVGGFNVYPAEVENVLYQHPAVAEAAVYGCPDAVMGERVHASVVLRPEAQSKASELIAFCRPHLAEYKIPVAIDFTTELPRARTGKILKRVLRERAQAVVPPEGVAPQRVESATDLQKQLIVWLAEHLGLAPQRIDPARPFAELGLTSVLAVELAEALCRWTGRPVQATITWQFSTIGSLCQFLTAGAGQSQMEPRGEADVAQLSEEEAEALLIEELARIRL